MIIYRPSKPFTEKLTALQEFLLGALSGAAQGIFEWLPVSSKTILLLIFYEFGASPSNAYVTGLFLNGATAAAAIIYFRKDLLKIIKGIYMGGFGRVLLSFLLVSTFMTMIVAVPLASLMAKSLNAFGGFSMIIIGILFALTSIISWIREKISTDVKLKEIPTLRDAILAGIAQGFSALPGISRSGITIFALLLLGHHPNSAVRLSFLMSIPATLGGSIYAYLFSPSTLSGISFVTVSTSIIISLVVSLAVISALLRISQKIKAHIFTAILAIIALLMGMISI